MFHGNDERVDVETLRLSTEMWQALARAGPARRVAPVRGYRVVPPRMGDPTDRTGPQLKSAVPCSFDFGGVILTSPFEAFAPPRPTGPARRPPPAPQRHRSRHQPWARLERNEVDLAGFAELFEAEAAAAGHRVGGRAVLALLAGDAPPADGRGPAPLPRPPGPACSPTTSCRTPPGRAGMSSRWPTSSTTST